MDIEYHIMGNRIKLRRKEQKIKQSELAELLNISNNHMSSIENGRERPSLEILLSICNILKITPDYLLLGCMHAKNIPRNISEGLRLCSKEDIELVKNLVELLVERNQQNWNQNNYT